MSDVHATLIHADGRRTELAASSGTPLMRAALRVGVEEIEAICGGAAMCGTCHVIVAETWASRLPDPLPAELEILDCLEEQRKPTSRLSCQIALVAAIDGLVVGLPGKEAATGPAERETI